LGYPNLWKPPFEDWHRENDQRPSFQGVACGHCADASGWTVAGHSMVEMGKFPDFIERIMYPNNLLFTVGSIFFL